MEHHSEVFVALDTAKLRNAVAIADAGRNTDVFKSRPHPCTICPPDPRARMAARGAINCAFSA